MSATSTIPRPADEAARLTALRRYQLLDTPADAEFDFLARMAATICGTPYAYVSLVDDDRVWYKSALGNPAVEAPRDQDYCSWSILENPGLHIADLRADRRTAGLPLTIGFPEYRMYCGANLVSSDGYRIGTLCVLDVVARALSPDTMALLTQLAGQVMSLIELRAKSQQLELAYAAMERLATTDELTGLLNRRALMARLQMEIDRSHRTQDSFALVMIDLDYFKRINDEHGHLCGDAVLREVGALLLQRMRSTDSAGRYGGEELAVLLFGAGLASARQVAEELRAAIADAAYAHGAVRATASFGVAVFEPRLAWGMDALIDAADKALFRAKHGGRDRVEVWDGGLSESEAVS